MTDTPQHLTLQRTNRGFTHLPALKDTYGGTVEAYESSAATGPHIWLKVAAPEGTAHLTAETAIQLAEQLVYLVQNHYQGPIDLSGIRQVFVSFDEAATILNVSREDAVQLAEAGRFETDRSQVLLSSLLAYKANDDAERADAAHDAGCEQCSGTQTQHEPWCTRGR